MHRSNICMNTGSGRVHGRSFNLYRTTNQLCITGQELTGNQWMQPPILHQYCPPPQRASLKEAALFCIYFKDAIVCLLFIHHRLGGVGGGECCEDRPSESGFFRPDWYQTMTAGGTHWRFLLRGSYRDNLGGRVRRKEREGGRVQREP